MRFRKKPIEIEAVRVSQIHHQSAHDWYAMPQWVIDAYEGKSEKNGVKTLLFCNYPPRVEVVTQEGVMTGNIDDWLIKGVKCELYPCKPDIFATTYEAVPIAVNPNEEFLGIVQ